MKVILTSKQRLAPPFLVQTTASRKKEIQQPIWIALTSLVVVDNTARFELNKGNYALSREVTLFKGWRGPRFISSGGFSRGSKFEDGLNLNIGISPSHEN